MTIDCRDGWLSEEAWRRLGRGYVCGIDTSSEMIEFAGRLRGVDGQLDFKTWDGSRLPFPDGRFDVAVWVFGIHRRRQPLEVLREVRRVLRAPGDFYLLEADHSSFGGLFALWDYFYRIVDRGHVKYYTSHELQSLFRQAGFADPREVKRYQKLLSGGKILGSAVSIHGRRAS